MGGRKIDRLLTDNDRVNLQKIADALKALGKNRATRDRFNLEAYQRILNTANAIIKTKGNWQALNLKKSELELYQWLNHITTKLKGTEPADGIQALLNPKRNELSPIDLDIVMSEFDGYLQARKEILELELIQLQYEKNLDTTLIQELQNKIMLAPTLGTLVAIEAFTKTSLDDETLKGFLNGRAEQVLEIPAIEPEIQLEVKPVAEVVPHSSGPLLARKSFASNFEQEFQNASQLLVTGHPALEFVQQCVRDEENRNFIFSDKSRAKQFKKQIYKKSIENMARAIINVTRNDILNINPNEFYNGESKSRDVAPTILAFTDNFNNLTNYVIETILKNADINQAVFTINYWINVAYECVMNPGLADLPAQASIIGGLNAPPIYRLLKVAEIQNTLPKKTLARLEEMNQLISPDKNTLAVRTFQKENLTALPRVDLINKDIIMAGESDGVAIVNKTITEFVARRDRIESTPFDYRENSFSYLTEKTMSKEEQDRVSAELLKREEIPDPKIIVDLTSQLATVEIHEKKTMIKASTAPVVYHEKPGYGNFKFYLDLERDTGNITKNALLALPYEVIDKPDPEDKQTLDLYKAAEEFCRKKITDPTHCLLNTEPFVRVLALSHYIMNSKPNADANKWLLEFHKLLTPMQRKKFGEFLTDADERASLILDILGSAPVNTNTTPNVLTITMLGTGEHQSKSKTLLTEFHNAIAISPTQSRHLINGPGAKSAKQAEDPTLGKYNFSCAYDNETGKISVSKTKKSKASKNVGVFAGLLAGKGMDDAISEAVTVVDAMMAAGKKPLILNMAGFSRGADNILRTANELSARYSKDDLVINIFALDPVPGLNRQDATRARLIPENVRHYEAILMRDDRRNQSFGAQDMSRVTRQDPNHTEQTYHLYHGAHSAGNIFGASKKSSAFNHAAHPAAQLAWDDLTQFAGRHGTELTKDMSYIHYINNKEQIAHKPEVQTDNSRLELYTDMLSENIKRAKKNKTRKAREFTKHQSDYLLHGNSYFLDMKHMDLFKKKYPNTFDYFFQMNSEFPGNLAAVQNEIVSMKGNKVLTTLNEYLDQDLTKITAEVKPQGINLIATEFYNNSTLYRLWKSVQNAAHSVITGHDKSTKVENAQNLYADTVELLGSKMSEADKIYHVANLINTELGRHHEPSSYTARLTTVVSNLGLPNVTVAKQHEPVNYIHSILENYKTSKPYMDIINTILHAMDLAGQTRIGADPAVINAILSKALSVSTQLQAQKIYPEDAQFDKQLRAMMLAISVLKTAPDSQARLDDAAKLKSVIQVEFDTIVKIAKATTQPPQPVTIADVAEVAIPVVAAPAARAASVEPTCTGEEVIQTLRELSATLKDILAMLDQVPAATHTHNNPRGFMAEHERTLLSTQATAPTKKTTSKVEERADSVHDKENSGAHYRRKDTGHN